MGQRIVIEEAQDVDDVLLVTTDRSLTGTDGEGFDSVDDASRANTFAARLAAELFEVDEAIERVYVHSNMVIVNRRDGWPSDARATAERVVAEFFLFYPSAG